jgi:hypothetical protein
MKLGIGFGLDALTEENLAYAKQLGVTHVIVYGPWLGEQVLRPTSRRKWQIYVPRRLLIIVREVR